MVTRLRYLQRKVKQQIAPFLQRAYTPLFYSGCVFHLWVTDRFVRLLLLMGAGHLDVGCALSALALLVAALGPRCGRSVTAVLVL